MKRFSEQLHKKSQTVKLKKAEQADLRERVVSYMEYHPLPADMKTAKSTQKKSVRQSLPIEAFTTYRLPFAQLFKFGGAFAAIVLIVIPFVAEQAVPGDTLYAVKVNINEEVRSSLTLDPYQKVEWETTRINRRITEAKLLQKEGRLTEEAEADAAAAVKQHADNAKAEIETLRVSDADEATIAEIALDSTLTVQAQSFDSAEGDEGTETARGVDLIADAIDESLKKPANQASSTLPALAKLTARVELNTTRLRELEVSLAPQIETSAAADVARRIDDIERLAADAFALPPEAEIDARTMLVDVLTRAQKLIVFMTDLEVRETVSIETVAPVILTKQEQERNRVERMMQLETYVTQLSAAEVEDEAFAEKLAAMTARLVQQVADLETITEYRAFVAESDKALTLGKDSLLLFEQAGIEIVAPIAVIVASTTDPVATSTVSTTEEVVEENTASTSAPTVIENEQTMETGTVQAETQSEEAVDETATTSSTTTDTQRGLDV